MNRKSGHSLWAKISQMLHNLKEEMYRNSVAAAGPSDDACCHKPVEELERKREEYRKIAAQRAINKRHA